jgi:hypothetical protein
MIVSRDGTTALSDLPTAYGLARSAGPEFTIEECGNPVGAELAIHGGDLKHCWTVAVAVRLLYLIFRQLMACLNC